MQRFVETMFRMKMLVVLPAVIVPVLALLFLMLAADTYRTETVAWVDANALLPSDERTATRTPNDVVATRLEEWLATDSFRSEVLAEAGLSPFASSGQWPPLSPLEDAVQDVGLDRVIGFEALLPRIGLVRPDTSAGRMNVARSAVGESITVNAEGDNLLYVGYVGNDPLAAPALVEAVIDVYVARTFEQRSADVQSTTEFYTAQLREQNLRVDAAEERLEAYLGANPAPADPDDRPSAEAAQIDALRRDVSVESRLYEDLLVALESARIEGEAGATGQRQQLRVIDPAGIADAAGIGFGSVVFTLIAGGIVGLVFGAGSVLSISWLDSKVRSREDVRGVVDAPSHLRVPLAPSSSGGWPSIGRLIVRDL